jgi:hypothetical protein
MVGACTPGAFNVVALMQVAKEQEIGWLPWSWGPSPIRIALVSSK